MINILQEHSLMKIGKKYHCQKNSWNWLPCIHDKAISYHRSLRDKEITKSDLDNIVGIGEAKKNALLKKFGSVAKIKEASIEEIAKISGITLELAEKIKENL